HKDERGFFARAFCQKEFADHGLKPTIAQANIASNRLKGTLRGMHFQCPPACETKIVRCTRGAILDIIVDLRPESPTYLQHIAVGLANRIVNTTPGMAVVAMFNRRIDRARDAFAYAGRADAVEAATAGAFEDAIRAGRPASTDDGMLLARSEQIDVLVDTTGS